MLNLLVTLENVFQKYIPWHSETELREGLQAIEDLRKEIQGNAPAAADAETSAPVAAAENAPAGAAENPTTGAEASTAAPAVDSTGTAPETVPANTTPVDSPAAPVSSVPTVDETPETIHIPEPEAVPFPGSYTPPPAS